MTTSPLKDIKGAVVGASKIARDMTERHRADAHQEMLIGELNHRVKNVLMTVQAIVSQTIRQSGSLDDFQGAFEGRLRALAISDAGRAARRDAWTTIDPPAPDRGRAGTDPARDGDQCGEIRGVVRALAKTIGLGRKPPATAIAALAPPPETFHKGRDFAAWLGLTPVQRSTGGKQKLGAVSKISSLIPSGSASVSVAPRSPCHELLLVWWTPS